MTLCLKSVVQISRQIEIKSEQKINLQRDIKNIHKSFLYLVYTYSRTIFAKFHNNLVVTFLDIVPPLTLPPKKWRFEKTAKTIFFVTIYKSCNLQRLFYASNKSIFIKLNTSKILEILILHTFQRSKKFKHLVYFIFLS